MLLFGYLVSLMFVKWVLYSSLYQGTFSEACAPSILITFINMILQGKTETPNCEEFMMPNQKLLQRTFLGVALACVPLMLFGKPLWVLCTRKHAKGKVYVSAEFAKYNVRFPVKHSEFTD